MQIRVFLLQPVCFDTAVSSVQVLRPRTLVHLLAETDTFLSRVALEPTLSSAHGA